jgi:hypothetical protein
LNNLLTRNRSGTDVTTAALRQLVQERRFASGASLALEADDSDTPKRLQYF